MRQIQEYVEAATVVEYSKSGRLLTIGQLNESFKLMRDAADAPFKVGMNDYILGVRVKPRLWVHLPAIVLRDRPR